MNHNKKRQKRKCCRGGYSMIAPNDNRRAHLQMMANKELEELKRWKESNRPGRINLTPVQLGGVTSEAEARRLQQINLRGSKFQQKARKEEYDWKKKEAEELEYQKKKEIQREKANKLLEKQRQAEEQRRAHLQAEHYQANQQFLQRIETKRASGHTLPPLTHTVQTTLRSEFAAENESRVETERHKRLQDEHRRKNKAFLDNLETSQGASENVLPFCTSVCNEENMISGNMHSAPELTSKDLRENKRHNSGCIIKDTFCRDSPKGTDSDWNLMKLQSCFPDYEMAVIEELLLQCDGDYEKLIQLLQ
ncbi:epithelial-stromal interaction protein 1 isoform X2 [Scyliorhinus canicula]|uniref:epithelial-stromal interaction protein 1 isoform X2 n=1 Tax=Scyliorhinus canicula TaxID=7830 RepID=UPI0018F37A24|nr:epithelial-stromal interaction protein 1 isoform X2 [Scyliorhinus canicula]